MVWTKLAHRLVMVVLPLVVWVGLAKAETADLTNLNASLVQLQEEQRALQVAVDRQAEENQELLSELDALDAPDASLAALRSAQSDVDIARARLLTLNNRVSEQERRLEQQDQVLQAAAGDRVGPPTTLASLTRDVELSLRGELRTQSAAQLAILRRYQELSDDFLSLRRERLLIVQQGIGLDAVDGSDQARNSPVAARLQTLIDRLTRSALLLANEASSMSGATATARAQRNLLRLRSDEALLRSNARYTDLALLEAKAVGNALAVLAQESGVPIRLYDTALEALDRWQAELRSRVGATDDGANALGDLQRIARQQSSGDARAALAASRMDLEVRLSDLSRLLSWQRSELDSAAEELRNVQTALGAARSSRERESLFVRTEVRTDELARARVAQELGDLPEQLEQIYSQRLNEVRTAFALSTNQERIAFGVGVIALLAFTVLLRQRILLRFIQSDATSATEVPLEVVRRNLFWLLPAALWALFCVVFDVQWGTELAIYPLLLVPAAAALVRDLTQVIVARRTEGTQRKIGRLITRLTEAANVIIAVVVLAYIVLQEAALLPSTQGAVNRVAYSVFVLSGLPMLLFVFFFAASGGGLLRFGNLISAALSLLAPVALLATGVVGLAGYSNLAALMLVNLGLAIAIIAALALAIGVLHDTISSVAMKVRERDPAQAYFLQTNVLRPGERMCQVALVVAAVAVAANVFGWSRDTPILREVLAVWNTAVFTASGTTYTIGSLAIAGFAFVLVFWIGAWSRRIAYSVVFGKLRDIGIRQSLSVFAQYVVIIIGVLLTLSAIGFDVTTLTVFAASLGVGIGFGLQNVVNNFISGVLLLVERPLRVGDIVTVGTDTGTVSQIGIRSMRMRTFDEFDLIVPNSALISDTFTNWTRSNSLMRVVIPVGIGYDDDPNHATDVVTDVLKAHPGVVNTPAPLVTVDDFGDSAVTLRVCYYIDLNGSFGTFVVRNGVLTQIWERFREEGISIPYPQRDVHLPQPTNKVLPAQPESVPRERPGEVDDSWQGEAIEMARSED